MEQHFVTPEPLNIRKSQVEDIAPQIADKLNFKPGDDLTSLVSRLGGKIVVGSTGAEDSESGSLIARALSDFTIFLSPMTSLERDRFTIAHELGHLILHLPKIKRSNPGCVMRATRYLVKGDEKQQRVEWEANWFAAAFLMPAALFKDLYKNKGSDHAKSVFQVSMPAIKARAQSLGLEF